MDIHLIFRIPKIGIEIDGSCLGDAEENPFSDDLLLGSSTALHSVFTLHNSSTAASNHLHPHSFKLFAFVKEKCWPCWKSSQRSSSPASWQDNCPLPSLRLPFGGVSDFHTDEFYPALSTLHVNATIPTWRAINLWPELLMLNVVLH